MYECTRESGVTHTAQSLHAHYLSKQKKNKSISTTNRDTSAGWVRRGETMIFVTTRIHLQFLIKHSIYLQQKKGMWHTLHSHEKELHYTEGERARGRWCKRRVDCLSLALTIAITKMSRRIVEENTHTDSQQQLIISKMFTRERKIYKCRKMIISTRYNKCYLL